MVVALEKRVERVLYDVAGVALQHVRATRRVGPDQVPTEMRPEEVIAWAVRIPLLIGGLMMPPVDRNPVWRRFHHTARSEQDQGALQPTRTGKAAVGQQAMEAEVDAESAE